jgi:hypothetical protein
MSDARFLIPCAIAAVCFAVQSCSSGSESEEAVVPSDSGVPDQTAEAAPDAVEEVLLEAEPEASPEAAVEAGADAVEDVVEEPLPPQQICAEYEPGFDENNPGMAFTFTMTSSYVMGNEIVPGVATFMKAAREDFCKERAGLEIELDTCTTQPEPAALAQCATKSDCGPEEECLPDENNGNLLVCMTPRAPLDVGPFTLSGFVDGTKTFRSNPGQSGAYTENGVGDGQLDPSTLVFDADYSFGGTLDGDAGLGTLSGTFHFPPAIEWVSPPLMELPSFPGLKMGIEVTVGEDLELKWTGGDSAAVMSFELAAANSGGATVTCKVANDGAFSIPAAMIEAVKLGNMPFLNMLDIRVEAKGPAVTGSGITNSKVVIMQSRMLNMIKK